MPKHKSAMYVVRWETDDDLYYWRQFRVGCILRGVHKKDALRTMIKERVAQWQQQDALGR